MTQAEAPGRREGLLSPRRLTLAGLSIAIGMVVAFALFVVTADGISGLAGGRLGGDWPAFHTAGVLARTDPAGLLDAGAQRAIMAEYLDNEFYPFPYPPVLGYLFAPATFVSFRVGYVIFVAMLLAAAALATLWLLKLYGISDDRWRLVAMLGALTYAGTFRSYTGAQNTTLTLAVLVGSHRLLAGGRQVQAGLVLGLLWYKPQFAIPAILLVAAGRHVRAALWALVPGVVLWTANAAVFGVGWVGAWSDGLLRVTDAGNRVFNTQATVSMVEYLRGRLEAPFGDLVGLSLAVVVGLGFAVVARRHPHPRTLLPLVCGALLLTAPHALMYELALLVPVMAAALAIRRESGVPAATMIYLLGWAMILAVHPVMRVAYVVATLAWWWIAERDRVGRQRPLAATELRRAPPTPARR